MKITEGAPQYRADVFKAEIGKILQSLKCKPAETFVTDDTCIRDIVGHEVRIDLVELSDDIGVKVKDARETIVDVAERMRKSAAV
jgi:hypothetical protein